MPASDPPDFEALASALARALALPVTEETLPGVATNLALAYRLAPAFLDFPLPDTLEPAAIFDPRPNPVVAP
ncbi:MAG: DUF4089 domain-containing protein [Beijerinckiaceae bacterium]|nr:DUF4089 domain-containing protein [Beijerinckiaceae bacterium]MCZ8300205.1 DUF4089 domain-containing protein [Beijerinckiaceae bacterium]